MLFRLVLLLLSCTIANITFAAPETITNDLDMRFVLIPEGRFLMGLTDINTALAEVPDAKPGELEDEIPAHLVVIPEPFYIGETEVTQQQWLAVMQNRPGPEANWQREDWKRLPVVSVSWFMASRFVEELNKMDERYRYRLPTEAEWEYVARAGSRDLRPVDIKELQDHAWYIENSGDVVQPVATRLANPYGVYDMLGNVWEWVADWYAPDAYKTCRMNDPQGPAEGVSKVRRGGSFHCPLHLMRPGYRSANRPATRYEVLGFRLVAESKN